MKRNLILFCFFCCASAFAERKFHCEEQFPLDLQIPAPLSCNQTVGLVLKAKSKKAYDDLLEKTVITNNNMGGSLIKFPNGKVKTVLRSSILANQNQCLEEVKNKYNLTTILNLFSQETLNESRLSDQEQTKFQDLGGKLYMHALGFTDRPQQYANEKEFYDRIAAIIHLIQNNDGNILIHCYGGEHRTGIIFGIMQKCYNQIPLDAVLDNYKCHSGWKDKKNPGKFYEFNAETIKKFPCALLNR